MSWVWQQVAVLLSHFVKDEVLEWNMSRWNSFVAKRILEGGRKPLPCMSTLRMYEAE